MRLSRLLCLLPALLAPLPAAASGAIYGYQSDDGIEHFSNVRNDPR